MRDSQAVLTEAQVVVKQAIAKLQLLASELEKAQAPVEHPPIKQRCAGCGEDAVCKQFKGWTLCADCAYPGAD